jgi:hypothetical protein
MTIPDIETDVKGEKILRQILKASFLKHISYGRARLPKKTLVKHLPESLQFISTFGGKCISEWYHEMEIHNRTVQRGLRLGLRPCRPSMVYSSLDAFLLQTRAIEIARAFEALVNFAERLAPLILQDEDASQWWLNSSILIHREHLVLLARHVLTLAKLAKLPESGIVENDMLSEWRVGTIVDAWPDWDRLQRSAMRASEIFSSFADSDDDDDSCAIPLVSASVADGDKDSDRLE